VKFAERLLVMRRQAAGEVGDAGRRGAAARGRRISSLSQTRGQKGLGKGLRTRFNVADSPVAGGFTPSFFVRTSSCWIRAFDHAQLRRRGRYHSELERTSGMARLRLSINTACTGNLDGRRTGMFQGQKLSRSKTGAAVSNGFPASPAGRSRP